MSSRQLEFRSSVLESGSRLPAVHRVTLSAVSAKLPAMLILVAADARATEPEVAVIQVLHLNAGACGGQNALCVVALFATQSGVPAREWETGLLVIHRLSARLPADERKVRTIVVGMAPNTILACCVPSYPDRMHAAIVRQAIPDFCVAIQTFELHSARA
jgi:hypothetical protein